MPQISQIKNFFFKAFVVVLFICAICGNHFAQNLPAGEAGSETYREGVQANGSRYYAQDAGASTRTDGFPYQFGGEKARLTGFKVGQGKKFMSKNLRELLAANSSLPMNEQKDLLEKTFKDWVGNLEQVDDVTVIGIRI